MVSVCGSEKRSSCRTPRAAVGGHEARPGSARTSSATATHEDRPRDGEEGAGEALRRRSRAASTGTATTMFVQHADRVDERRVAHHAEPLEAADQRRA